MSIRHGTIDLPDQQPVVFAQLAGISCSVCAPLWMVPQDIETFAQRELGRPIGGWECVDKGQLGLGLRTPHPCNMDGRHRQHWFLLSGAQASQFRLGTKKP